MESTGKSENVILATVVKVNPFKVMQKNASAVCNRW